MQRVTEWRTGFSHAAATVIYEMYEEMELTEEAEISGFAVDAVAAPQYIYLFKHLNDSDPKNIVSNIYHFPSVSC